MGPRGKPSRKSKCPHCDYTPPTRQAWERHERTHSSERPFACPSCDWKFALKRVREQHVKQVHKKEGRVTCSWDACEATFIDARDMRAHVESLHLKQRFPCSVDGCSVTFAWKASLAAHIRAAHTRHTYACSVEGCDYRSAYHQHIRSHVRAKHEKRIHSCPHEDCSFTTSWSESLRRHLKARHATVKRRLASCHVCGKRIEEQLQMKQHLLTHAREDGHPFENCPSCQEEMDKGSTVHPDLHLLLNLS